MQVAQSTDASSSLVAEHAERGGWAWAAYLGMSWTWCIGMFLPVLLVRDFGIAGFLVFALPNVIGAAAMGWVLTTPEQSRKFLAQHRSAGAAFSAVTICFHCYFLSWVVYALIGPPAWMIAGGAAALFLLLFRRRSLALAVAWILLLASLVAWAMVMVHAPRQWQSWHLAGARPSMNLLGLAPICIFGFALCPYLDLTFHRARQATSATGGRIAFTLGFGVCFAAMILFTLYYSHLLDPARWGGLTDKVAWIIAVHLAVQSGFTIAAHLDAMARQSPGSIAIGRALGWMMGLAPLLARLLFPTLQSPEKAELIYRFYMGFYGLVFPAYLWICHKQLSARSLVVTVVSVLIAGPLFWLGFIRGQMLWLIPGLTVIMLARLVARHGQQVRMKVSPV